MMEDRTEIKTTTIITANGNTVSEELLTSSSFTKQLRIIAYCQCFANNSRKRKEERRVNHLTTNEIQKAKETIIRIIQMEAFEEEIKALKRDKALKTQAKY